MSPLIGRVDVAAIRLDESAQTRVRAGRAPVTNWRTANIAGHAIALLARLAEQPEADAADAIRSRLGELAAELRRRDPAAPVLDTIDAGLDDDQVDSHFTETFIPADAPDYAARGPQEN